MEAAGDSLSVLVTGESVGRLCGCWAGWQRKV